MKIFFTDHGKPVPIYSSPPHIKITPSLCEKEVRLKLRNICDHIDELEFFYTKYHACKNSVSTKKERYTNRFILSKYFLEQLYIDRNIYPTAKTIYNNYHAYIYYETLSKKICERIWNLNDKVKMKEYSEFHKNNEKIERKDVDRYKFLLSELEEQYGNFPYSVKGYYGLGAYVDESVYEQL